MREEHEAELAANRPPPVVERIARRFWASKTPVPWDDVPETNRQLMLAVVGELLEQAEIVAGYARGSFEAAETHPDV